MDKPLAFDLFCGKGGWTLGLIAAGWRVIGFDIANMGYPEHEDCQLVLQDVLTIDGRRLRSGGLIVASPPCQKYSWLAMPWSRSKSDGSQAAKALRKKWETEGPDNALFGACFRIAMEAGLPVVVENVKGAQEWVGVAKAHYGSFYLWGDVASVGGAIVAGKPRFGEVLRPVKSRKVNHHLNGDVPEGTGKTSWFFGNTKHELRDGVKNSDTDGRTWFGVSHGREYPGQPGNPVNGRKGDGGGWFSDLRPDGTRPHWKETACVTRRFNSRSAARKEASAMIAKIPFELAYHVGTVFHPNR